MNKWQHLYNQLNKQNRQKIFILLIDQLDNQARGSWVQKLIMGLVSLDRLSLIYLITVMLIQSALGQVIVLTSTIWGVILGGSFAIALVIDSMIRSTSMIIQLITNKGGNN